MKSKRKKSIFTKIVVSNFILLVSIFLIIFFSSNLIRDFINKRGLIQEVNRLKDEIDTMTQRNSELGQLIGYLESDDYLEEEARLKLNKKKPDEKIIIVKPIQENQSTTTLINNDQQISKENDNNLLKWINYFFKEN